MVSLNEYEEVLRRVLRREMSASKDNWQEENPFMGTCAVVALLTQKQFGGEILRASLEGTEFGFMRSHYVNYINGEIVDLSGSQFGDKVPELNFVERKRSELVFNEDTAMRLALLTLAFYEEVSGKEDKLFKDEIYLRCIKNAIQSPCQKAGFGAVVIDEKVGLIEGCNTTIDELSHLCDPECIRFNIQSRTESMIGACGHAEEWTMKKARDAGVVLAGKDMYVAGIKIDGMLWIKSAPEHTCLRCALQQHMAGLNVMVPYAGEWVRISHEDAVLQASLYATGINRT